MPHFTSIPNRSTLLPTALMAALAGVAAVGGGVGGMGCQRTQPSNAASPELQAVSAPSSHTLLRKSRGTINFLVIRGGTITVYDATADRPLVSAQVAPQTLVRIDVREGIFFGPEQLAKGPLPEKNVRELRLEN
jgi:hypothetical protein